MFFSVRIGRCHLLPLDLVHLNDNSLFPVHTKFDS